jgi:DNA-binding transcriptional MerR regulator
MVVFVEGDIRISQAAQRLLVSPQHLRMLEWEGKIPPARRDYNGRLYSEFDIALLRVIGVGSRPQKLKRPEEILGEAW